MSEASVTTTPYLSSVHAAIMSKKIAAAHTRAELDAVAAEHGRWLIGRDKERLRQEYRHRRRQLRGAP